MFDESIKYIETFLSQIKRYSKIDKRVEALAYIGLASSYVEKGIKGETGGYYNKAKSYFETASRLLRDSDLLNISISSGLGFVYLKLGDHIEAIKSLEKGLKRYPLYKFKKEYLDILTNLGYAYLDKKDFLQAKEYFTKALEVSRFDCCSSSSLSIYLGLASSYRELGEYEQVLKYLNMALKDY
ncbi:MAG: tetratricopeptide repeat protein, partial [Candidatus Omnitrophica bacterium]|nr:tetratricopeptide repeat protein [Candidatus Omnitrophota bacterium]